MDVDTQPIIARPPAPGPTFEVDCPWCAEPVALEADIDLLTCTTCRVTVELAPAAATATPRRPLTAAA